DHRTGDGGGRRTAAGRPVATVAYGELSGHRPAGPADGRRGGGGGDVRIHRATATGLRCAVRCGQRAGARGDQRSFGPVHHHRRDPVGIVACDRGGRRHVPRRRGPGPPHSVRRGTL